MYKIDRIKNRITPIEARGFGQLGFNERQHLQEWLENFPQALAQADGDDELLIIQKEFAGFDDTRERLDLLALDKEGNLVIIENKTDDSGRDVVWQAVKYASYCANLSKLQVVDIYQRYLNQRAAVTGSEPEDADTNIVEFLELDDLESAQINRIQSQRIIFVAMKYRKEVTNAVQWLSQYGISCQCFRVTPYQSGEELFISMEQIIPPPEARDFMIGMIAKEQEEKTDGNELQRRHVLRLAFWEMALQALKRTDANTPFSGASTSKSRLLKANAGVKGVSYELGLLKDRITVRVNPTKAGHAAIRIFLVHKEQIEQKFGEALAWEKKDNAANTFTVSYERPVDGFDKDGWDDYVEWMVTNLKRLEDAVKDALRALDSNYG